MEKERIKELMFSKETKYCFPSNELYLLFGFSRHNNFLKLLNNDKEYSKYILSKPWEKINYRKSSVYYITRELFFLLYHRYFTDCNFVDGLFLDYKTTLLKSKIEKFEYYSKHAYIPNSAVITKIKGHFYTYNLNTLNIANELNIDAYDLFKFCSTEFCNKVGYERAQCTNAYGHKYEAAIPYYSFDHIYHEKRHLFIELLNILKTKYKLTDFQKQLLHLYSSLIKKMLEKQLEFDIKEQRRPKKPKIYTFQFNPVLTKEEKDELKNLFRKAAMLCHPDKNENGEDIFKELNEANKNNNLLRVKSIYETLLNS